MDERKYADIYYEDTITCHFDHEQGWSFGVLNSVYLYDDWSKIIGKKFYTGILNGEYFNIEVLDFNTYAMTVEVKITGHTDKGWRMKAGDVYDKVNPWTEYVDKIIYDIPETVFSEELDYSTEIEDYYFVKNDDNIYGNGCNYELKLSEEASPAEHIFSIFWDCDIGISWFVGFWEDWEGGLQEVE